MKKSPSLVLSLAGAFALTFTFTHAYAAENGEPSPYSPAYIACSKKAGAPGFYDQSAASECVAAEVKFQKKRINAAYDKIVKMWANEPSAIDQLNKSQKEWVQWRDDTYNMLGDHGGSNGQVVYIVSSGFLLKALADQASLLEGILSANGGE